MVSLQIQLPDDVISKIKALSVKTEDFVLTSVRKYLLEQELKNNNLLVEGYKKAKLENNSILNDFKHADTEHWDEY